MVLKVVGDAVKALDWMEWSGDICSRPSDGGASNVVVECEEEERSARYEA